MGHDELPDACKMSGLGGHGGGGVLAGKGHFGFGVGKGGFVDEDVGVAGEFDRSIAEYGVGAVDHAASIFRGSNKISSVYGTSVWKGDGLAVFEFAVKGAEGNAFCFGFFDVEGAGAIAFGDAVPVGGDAVFEEGAVYAKFAVVHDKSGFDGMNTKGIGEMGLGVTQGAG